MNSPDSFSIQPCSLTGEELWSLWGGEAFWFWVFSSILCWSLPIFVDLYTYGLCCWWLSYGVSEWISFCCWWISFYFLVFLLIVRPPSCRTAGGSLQTLLAWGSLAVAAEQKGLLPVSSSVIFVPEGYLPDVSLTSPLWGVSFVTHGSGSCLRRQSVPYRSSSAELWALLFHSELLGTYI